MSKRSNRRRPIPNDQMTTDVTQLSHEGRGIAHIDGKTTFLFGALPNEKVTFQYTKCHKQFDEGKVIAVLEPATNRVAPRCEHFGICGGCQLQHLAPAAQIKYKESILLEHFLHQANCKPHSMAPPIQADIWQYRRKARLSVRYVAKKNKVLVGFREQDGRFVADITSCPILHPSVGEKIECFSDLLMPLEAKTSIPQIEIAVSDNATAIIVRHLNPLSVDDLTQLKVFAATHQYQLYLQPKGPDTIHCVFPEKPEELFYELPAYNLTLFFKTEQFMQVNHAVNLKMLDQAIEWLDLQPTDQVLDLFCGIGNFSLPMAKYVAQVIGVEGASTSIAQAKYNAAHNKINNAEFFVHDLTQPVEGLPWSAQQYDKILLDPPRAGAKEMMPYIKYWQPSRVVYVSCNPITLARDTQHLLHLGYRLEKAGVMDMFPHTQHVEAMALFIKEK